MVCGEGQYAQFGRWDVLVNSDEVRIQVEAVVRSQLGKGSPSGTKEGFFGGGDFRISKRQTFCG